MAVSIPLRVVVMGVAGSGKSTVARAIADHFGARFVEADDHHLPTSVEKMAAGVALTDDDRWPWLISLQQILASGGAGRAGGVVVACSALRRSYRDLLRRAGGVRFVYLDVDRSEIERRLGERRGHFMGASMAESQFGTLEVPGSEETDTVTISGAGSGSRVIDAALRACSSAPFRRPGSDLPLSGGAIDRVISSDELRVLVRQIAFSEILGRAAKRVLLVPPDHTRLHSRAGEITAELYEVLTVAGCDVDVLPALGTHTAMSEEDCLLLFGDRIPYARIVHHQWRTNLVRVGEISAAEVGVLSHGRFTEPIPVETDQHLLLDWDLVVSVGQVVPHEVIGMANFTKNIVIGLGGAPTVHRSHFLGAISDMETIMGRADSPVRHVVDAAFDRFLAERVKVLWVLTVMEDTAEGVVQRGLFVGSGRSSESGGAAFRAAAELAASANVQLVSRPFSRVACWLDPDEFRSTWLGNKSVYRTRMAIADGGELIVLAPGVRVFGEDPAVDALIRRHGYRGTPATLEALGADPELAASLGAAAHLIHGSSEGRFRIVYCTDPMNGGLTREEVESVGFSWWSFPEASAFLGVDALTASGSQLDVNGEAFDFIANPALGLWATSDRFAGAV